MIAEPNCFMDWEIYLDWLADQGFDDLREIPVYSLVTSSVCLSDEHYHALHLDNEPGFGSHEVSRFHYDCFTGSGIMLHFDNSNSFPPSMGFDGNLSRGEFIINYNNIEKGCGN